jgi:N utilization substance protein B
MGKRRSARELALKFLYQEEFNVGGRPQHTEQFLEQFLDKVEIKSYTRDLVNLVFDHREEIDGCLQKCSENWALHRMTVIDRNILRIGACELLYRKDDVPPKVAIDEAVEIAKRYGSEDSPDFINGVLDRFKRELEREVAVS